MTAPPIPDWWGLAAAAAPLAVVVGVLAARRVGQVRALLVATLRMIVQLALLGVVLRWVFTSRGPWLVLAASLAMLAVSAHTVGGRLGRSRWAVRAESFLALVIAAATAMAVITRLTLHLEPWYRGPVFVPILGMILGNSVNAVALAAERLESQLRSDRDLVERRLALGATSRQAAMPEVRAAIQAGLTPVINGMLIAGIVAIPGMSTGQILAGMDVAIALRYQVMIYLAIAGTVGISTLILLELRLRRVFTASSQLRRDWLEGHDG
jgi:putative ABC transport system permease protein